MGLFLPGDGLLVRVGAGAGRLTGVSGAVALVVGAAWLVAGPVGSPADVVAVAAEGDFGSSLTWVWASAGSAMQIAATVRKAFMGSSRSFVLA